MTDTTQEDVRLHHNVSYEQYWLDSGFNPEEAKALAQAFTLLTTYQSLGSPEYLAALVELAGPIVAEIESAKAKHGDKFVAHLPLTTAEDEQLLYDISASGKYAKFIIEEIGAPSQMAVLMEEVGEVADAILDGKTSDLGGELTQVSTMGVVMAERLREEGL